MGVLEMKALLFGVYIRATVFFKFPSEFRVIPEPSSAVPFWEPRRANSTQNAAPDIFMGPGRILIGATDNMSGKPRGTLTSGT